MHLDAAEEYAWRVDAPPFESDVTIRFRKGEAPKP
jgi:hypothetical protein